MGPLLAANAPPSEGRKARRSSRSGDPRKRDARKRLARDVRGSTTPRIWTRPLRELTPDVEKAIKALLRNEHSSWEGIISKFASELVMQAKDKNDASDEYAEVDDMFSFLD